MPFGIHCWMVWEGRHQQALAGSFRRLGPTASRRRLGAGGLLGSVGSCLAVIGARLPAFVACCADAPAEKTRRSRHGLPLPPHIAPYGKFGGVDPSVEPQLGDSRMAAARIVVYATQPSCHLDGHGPAATMRRRHGWRAPRSRATQAGGLPGAGSARRSGVAGMVGSCDSCTTWSASAHAAHRLTVRAWQHWQPADQQRFVGIQFGLEKNVSGPLQTCGSREVCPTPLCLFGREYPIAHP